MTFRYARHTNSLEKIIEFYTEILGLEVLGKFENHDHYNGVFIGLKNTGWHLEFTESGEPAKHQFDEDDLLVFYPETENEFKTLINRIETKNIEKAIPKNPYWKSNGIMIFDPDGHGIVISPQKCKTA